MINLYAHVFLFGDGEYAEGNDVEGDDEIGDGLGLWGIMEYFGRD